MRYISQCYSYPIRQFRQSRGSKVTPFFKQERHRGDRLWIINQCYPSNRESENHVSVSEGVYLCRTSNIYYQNTYQIFPLFPGDNVCELSKKLHHLTNLQPPELNITADH